ncbi:MAG: substrate-binding domain-containing protein [Candidatus Velthaea sp.]
MTAVCLNTGICPNALCPNGVSRVRIDRYPGPGEFCPECGDLLEVPLPTAPAAPAASVAPAAVTPPAPSAAAPIAAVPLRVASVKPAMSSLLRGLKNRPRRELTIAGAGGLALIASLTVAGPIAAARHVSAAPVNVCATSSTGRLAADLVRGFATKDRGDAARFTVNHAGACDVRFTVATSADAKTVAAFDGFVAVVNPQNATLHLSVAQLGAIFAGTITDWSQVGGAAGRIVPVLPPEGTDEVKALANLTRRTNAGSNVRRFDSSAEVTHAVAAAAGRRFIGFVAFSSAVPAKVVRLDALPAPSAVTIAAHRYPLAVDVVVQPTAEATPLTSALIAYARSDDAQAIVTRDGFVAQRGF